MKQELFNIGEYEEVYKDIDRLDYRKLEDLNGDNLFFAFLKENEEVTLNCLAAINHKIYNFNTHKFIDDNAEITFARSFSDIMPATIWRLVHIVNHDVVSIEIDDYKSYLVENFYEWYHDKKEENAKAKILRNGYILQFNKNLRILNRKNLRNINGSNIFLAILEKVNKGTDLQECLQDNIHMMEITYDGIEISAELLKGMIETGKINLPQDTDLNTWIEEFKSLATEELDKYWYLKLNASEVTANFISSINGRIYNFCTNEYLDLNEVDINYAAPIEELLTPNEWSLSYSVSGHLKCLTIEESAIEVLSTFQHTKSNEIDKLAKAKVLKNGYNIK